MIASISDLLRLCIMPILVWAAWRDVKTRRLPSYLWPPLVMLGVVLLVWDTSVYFSGLSPIYTPIAIAFLFRVSVSCLIIIPLSYGLWAIGGFGGADAKVLMTLAILIPTVPIYQFLGMTFPVVTAPLGVFSLTILTNTVVLTAAYPINLILHNITDRVWEFPAALFARPVSIDDLDTEHGQLAETSDRITRNGIDLDALRMYLRWRGTTLSAIRESPTTHRNPASIIQTYAPTDGAVSITPDRSSVERTSAKSHTDMRSSNLTDFDSVDATDVWGADRFLEAVNHRAYGSSPTQLRDTLTLLSAPDRQTVWVSPGIPFLVPICLGTVIAFTYGDILFGLVISLYM
ncbi:prepilin peptidase [Haloquadratum walsbyi]|uniref:prepilin peptidase n=1 Tax=Haloquadratum walsbyi TaxID=293091 RepID=UPI0015F4B2C7|nr:A24 family peptidase [Haloquadratum walsbyi]